MEVSTGRNTAGELIGTFDAVILDHDGTIVDSHDAMVRAYTSWALEYGIELTDLPYFLGRPSNAIAEALVAPDRQHEAAQRIEDLEVADTTGVRPMPGAAVALAALPTHAVAIATSCTRPLLEARMRAAQLPLPPIVVVREDVVHGKPAPDTFLRAAELLGVEPSRALVVEDAPAGVAAARAGGFPVLGITAGSAPKALNADIHVPDLSHVSWQILDHGIEVRIHDESLAQG